MSISLCYWMDWISRILFYDKHIKKLMIYNGWLIQEVFRYTNGKSDWQIYPDEGNEQGYIVPSKTLEEVKEEINERCTH